MKEHFMIKKTLLLMLVFAFSSASNFDLKHILGIAKENNTLVKSIEQERLQRQSQALSDTASEPFELFGSGATVHPKGASQDFEYGVGISKSIALNDTKDLERSLLNLQNEADMLEADKKVLNFRNGLKNLYHQHCLDYKNFKSFKKNYADFVTLYEKKQKAYSYQEISKAELMQLEIEKNRLHASLEKIKMTQRISKQKLFGLGQVPHPKKTHLYCADMYTIREDIKGSHGNFALSKEAQSKRHQSTQVALKRHSVAVDSINLSVQYDQEINIDKYSVGFSIPLNFSSKKSEHARASALYESASLEYAYEHEMLAKKSHLKSLKSTLQSTAKMIRSLKNNLKAYEEKLLPLMKRSYAMGETTVIEYLLNRRNYRQLKQELFAMQKSYYHTLFSLYTISETKDNS